MPIPTLPTPISLSDIGSEYGATPPYSLTDFLGENGAPSSTPCNITDWEGLSDNYTITQGAYTTDYYFSEYGFADKGFTIGSITPTVTPLGDTINECAYVQYKPTAGTYANSVWFVIGIEGSLPLFTSITPQDGNTYYRTGAMYVTEDNGFTFYSWYDGILTRPVVWDGTGDVTAVLV